MKGVIRLKQKEASIFVRRMMKNLTEGVSAVIGITKAGIADVQMFIFDKEKFDDAKAKTWVKSQGVNIVESVVKAGEENFKVNLKERAPVGSFEYVADILRDALNRVVFSVIGASPWLMYVYPEKILVSSGSKYFEITYKISLEEDVEFGDPVEVEQYYAPKNTESATKEAVTESPKKTVTLADELKESGIQVTRQAVQMDLDLGEFVHLREYNAETGEVEIVIIEAGTNAMKKRHYPDSTIREAAPLFAGLKMYINHPTAKEEQERPERDLRDWVSTIVESRYENGKAVGKVAVHDDWLRERLKDSVARENIGVSINTAGKISYGKVNGEEMQIVEKIIVQKQNGPASVDWVTEAGARGRVSRLLKESQGGNQ